MRPSIVLAYPPFYLCTLLYILMLFSGQAAAQEIYPGLPKWYAGFGVCSNHFVDALSFSANQASLARTERRCGGLYSERPWLLDNLFQYSATLAFPFKKAGMGIVADYAGDGQFHQSQLGLAYGRKLSGRLDLGVQFNYQEAGINGYGKTAGVNAELGAVFRLNSDLQIGLHIANPRVRSRKGVQRQAAVYSSALGYEVSPLLFLNLNLVKQEGGPPRFMAGIQYNVKKQVLLRAGLLPEGCFLLGAGLSWKNIRTDLTAFMHPQLGITPGLLICFHQPN